MNVYNFSDLHSYNQNINFGCERFLFAIGKESGIYLIEEVLKIVNALDIRSQKLLKWYYGLDGADPLTMLQIAQIMQISKSRVDQLIKSRLEMLKEYDYTFPKNELYYLGLPVEIPEMLEENGIYSLEDIANIPSYTILRILQSDARTSRLKMRYYNLLLRKLKEKGMFIHDKIDSSSSYKKFVICNFIDKANYEDYIVTGLSMFCKNSKIITKKPVYIKNILKVIESNKDSEDIIKSKFGLDGTGLKTFDEVVNLYSNYPITKIQKMVYDALAQVEETPIENEKLDELYLIGINFEVLRKLKHYGITNIDLLLSYKKDYIKSIIENPSIKNPQKNLRHIIKKLNEVNIEW